MSLETIPECFYRISVKALILNEERDKFLICQEDNHMWELPGGGLDHGASPHIDLPRELMEEMGLSATHIADHPSYFLTQKMLRGDTSFWIANVIYETTVSHLNFTPSDECVAIDWVNKHTVGDFNTFPNVEQLSEQFDPSRH